MKWDYKAVKFCKGRWGGVEVALKNKKFYSNRISSFSGEEGWKAKDCKSDLSVSKSESIFQVNVDFHFTT